MTANVGRLCTLTWGGSAIAGVREKGLTINGAPVDISSDDDDGWRNLLDIADENSVDISISGVLVDDDIKDDIINGDRTQTAVLTRHNGSVWSGTFFMHGYEESHPYKGEATFSCTLSSMGPVTFTPPA